MLLFNNNELTAHVHTRCVSYTSQILYVRQFFQSFYMYQLVRRKAEIEVFLNIFFVLEILPVFADVKMSNLF